MRVILSQYALSTSAWLTAVLRHEFATARAAMHAEVAVLTAQYACNSHAYEEQLWCQ